MQITLILPDELVERARGAGLLTADRVTELLEQELRRKEALKRFGEVADALQAGGMSETEVNAELQARKRERLRE